jgi:hypothetical protein
MHQKEVDARFSCIVIEEAACDSLFRGAHEWLLLGRTCLLDTNMIETIDQAEIYADIAEKYGLSPEEIQLAAEICEMNILSENN